MTTPGRIRGDLRPALWGLVRLLRARLARRRPDEPVWTDREGSLTAAQLAALAGPPRTRPDPEVVREPNPRLLASRLIAGIRERRTLLIVPARDGGAAEAAARAAAPTRSRSRRVFDMAFTTSGTTGTPRLHASERGPLVALQLLGALGRLPDAPRPVVASLAALDHGHGFGVFLSTRLLGGRLVLLDREHAVDLLLAEPRVDLLSGVPVQLERLCAALEERGVRPNVRNVLSGSDPLDPALAERLERVLGAGVGNAYGSTETGTVCIATPADRRIDLTTVGRPLAGCTVASGPGGRLLVTAPMHGRRVFAADAGWVGADGLVRVTGRIG